MRSFKKMLRLIGLVLLLVLATMGVGLSGGVPVRSVGKRDEMIEISVQLDEAAENPVDAEQEGIKS